MTWLNDGGQTIVSLANRKRAHWYPFMFPKLVIKVRVCVCESNFPYAVIYVEILQFQ